MASSIPYRLGRLYGRLNSACKLLLLAGAGVCIVLAFTPDEPSIGNEATSIVSSNPASAPTYDPIAKWGQAKVAAAKKVMTMVQQDASIYEEGSHLVVEMRTYIDEPERRLQYIRAIADTDVILHGSARNVYFYDPSNKKIGQADRLNGIRLVD